MSTELIIWIAVLASALSSFVFCVVGYHMGASRSYMQIGNDAVEFGLAEWRSTDSWTWIEDNEPYPNWDRMTDAEKNEAIRKAV